MAQVAKMEAVIDLKINDNGVASQVEKAFQNAKKIADKDGIKFKVNVDEAGLVNFTKTLSKINDGKNKIAFTFDKDAFIKSFGSLDKEGLTQVEAFAKKAQDLLNGVFTGGSSSGNSNGVLNGHLQSLEQISSQIEQQKKRYNELQQEVKKYNSAVEEASKKSAQGVKDSWNNYVKSDSAKDRKEFVRQFKAFEDNGFDKKLLNGKDAFGEVFNFDKFKQKYEKQLKDLPKSFNLNKEAQKISEQFKLPFDKSQFEEYRKENNQIVAQIRELQKQKQELEKVQKESQSKKTDTSSNGNKNNEVKTDSTSRPVNIEPANLEEFYGKIEGFRAAKINVEVGNRDTALSELEKKPIEVKVNTSTSDKELYNDITKRVNSYKDTKAETVGNEISKLLKSSVESKTALDNSQIKELIALTKVFKAKTGGASPVNGILQSLGVKNYDDVIAGYGDTKKQYEDYRQKVLKAKQQRERILQNQQVSNNTKNTNEDNKISVTPIVAKESVSAIKAEIEAEINPVNITLNPVNVSDLNGVIEEQVQSSKGLVVDPYTEMVSTLQEISSLQKTVSQGNMEIAKSTDSIGKLNNKFIDPKDIKGKSVTQKSIKNLLSEYDSLANTNVKNGKSKDVGTESLKTTLSAYVASFNNNSKAQQLFGEQHKHLWEEVANNINKATAAKKAYDEISNKKDSLLKNAEKIKSQSLTDEETKKISNSLHGNDLTKTLNDILNPKSSSITTNLEETKKEVQELDASAGKLGQSLKENLVGGDSGFDVLRGSITELVESIGTISTAYQTSVNAINSGATAQIESVNAVKSAITELGSSLELVGVKTLEELPQYKEQMAQIQAEQDKLAKEKEAFQKLKDKKASSSGKGSKGKTEELTDTEKLKKAFKKTKGWTLDESSIQKQSNGIITYVAELEKAEGEAERFLLTVGNVNDIITKTGTINKKDYLNKAQPLSPTTENIKVEGGNDSSTIIEKTVDDITRLKEIASNTIGFKLDESSIAKADNGIISFKANLDGTDGKVRELNYELESLSRVINSKGEFTDSFLGKGKTDDELKAIEEQKKVLETKAKQTETLNKLSSAADKTNNFVLNSSSIDSEGFIRFSGYVEEANGKVKELSFSVKELESVLGANGGLNSNFIDQANLTKIEETLTKFKSQTAENKTNEAVGVDNTEGLERARQLEAQINELIASGNVSEEQRKATILEIAATKAKEAELYKVSDPKNYSAQQSVETAKNNYNNVLSSIDFSNFNTGVAVFDQMSNEVVDVKTKMESLKATAAGFVDELSKGEFANKGAFEQTKQSLQETLTAMKELANNPIYQQTNKKGQTFWQTMFDGQNLNTMTTKDVEKGLTESLSQSYQKILKNVKYNASNKTATATVLNNGNVEKVTMSLNAYTDAVGKAQVAVHKLNTDEGTYVTSGQKWVDGIKGKIASLSQYVTGLTLVMRVWSEIKQGFNFVKELDSSLTTINQTMSTTKDQLNDLGQGSIDAGKNLGSSAQDVLDATTIYANANETTESVLEKAKPTVMLANASGGSVSEASDQIQSVTQQFSELEGQEERIVNSYEKISAGIAVDFQKGIGIIAEGTQNAGSVAKESGRLYA